jgi:type IV pilus assembly protein PilE
MLAATKSRRPRREVGFTLVELMVTILIASILLGISIPSYINHIRKARRTDARTALLDLASREERYYSLNNVYTASAKNLGYSTTDTPLSQIVGNGYYTLSVDPATVVAATTTTAATFLAKATATGSQTKDVQCGTFTIDQSGTQTAQVQGGTTDTTATCWN